MRRRSLPLAVFGLALLILITGPMGASAASVWRPLPVLERAGLVLGSSAYGWDSYEVGSPAVLYEGGTYHMWYHGSDFTTWRIGYATSLDGRIWTKHGIVLSGGYEDGRVLAYAEVLRVGDALSMWYSAYDDVHYRIFLATSLDGLHWTKQGLVLDVGPAGSADDLMVADPAVVVRRGTYYMWYTAISSTRAGQALGLATSSDGRSWTKQGIVLEAGPAGSSDASGAGFATVRSAAGRLRMFYTGFDAGTTRVLYAESADGIQWSKKGVVLDVLAPNESPTLANPHLVLAQDGTLRVYYAARGAALDIYLATGGGK